MNKDQTSRPSLWKWVSTLGISPDADSLASKAIVLANRINFVLALLSAFLIALTFYDIVVHDREVTFYTTRIILLLAVNIFNLILSAYKKVRLMQILTSLAPVSVIIVIPTLLGYVQSSSFFYYHLVFVGLSIIPQLVFVPGKDNLPYWLTMLVFFLLILVLDDMLLNFAASEDATKRIIGFFKLYYKVVPVVVFVFLHSGLYYLRSLNVDFEKSQQKALNDLHSKVEELHNTQNKLVKTEKLASIGTLAAGISHEINNPLNFIKGGVHLLKEHMKPFNGQDDLIEKSLGAIDVGIARASAIVKSMNHFNRASEENDKEIDIALVVDNCLVILGIDTMQEFKVEKEYGKGTTKMIGNEGRIHQVFFHLLQNSQQAMPNGGIIQISTRHSNGHLKISIKDNGEGIPPAHLEKVMDLFYTTKPPGKGTGMGLTIAQWIVKEHDGEISVSSEVGNGTEFTIELPLA